MNAPEIINLSLLFASSAVTLYLVGKTFYKVINAKQIQVTRKDTGKSVVVSRKFNQQDMHKLAELVK